VRSRYLRAGLVGATLVAVFAGTVVAADAFSGAFFHTQSRGNRGVDTQAIQYLLQAHGVSVTADGVFGSGTESAVRSFQSGHGLGADGIVGPATWGALVVTVQQGSTGPAVRALQALLNRKRRLALAVDGNFGSGTRAAVIAFQSHAGIGADGVVGPVTWRNLVWHYAYPSVVDLCDQNPDGTGTAANWGTGQGLLPLGDIGFEHGGDIPGHATHDAGLDVDVWPIRTDSAQCTAGRITWQSSTYDRAATRQLVQMIRSTAPGHVSSVLFNDPVLINEGLTTFFDNHDNHLHIIYA
jgi:peptidoglycan hydrolase-like protein with peptidoglycan-binding domain